MAVPTIIPANSVSGYNITNSLRFNQGDSPVLTKTFSSAGTEETFTWSGWVKRGSDFGTRQVFFGADNAENNNASYIRFTDDETIQAYLDDGNSLESNLNTSAKFRDVSAWYHIVWAVDTTQGTDTNRVKVYVNGVQITAFGSPVYPPQNFVTDINAANEPHYVGTPTAGVGNDYALDGYITEVNFVDGSQLTPTSFGEFDDNGVWIPKKYTGSYGTNGFFLEFKQTGTSQNAAGIGADTSGSGNHFAVTNLAATDIGTDTCTNNFCTLNSLDIDSTSPTLAEGNLDYHSANGTAFNPVRSTFAVTKGKWYAEWKYINTAGFLGVISTQSPLTGNIASDADVRSILRIPAGLYAGRNNSGGFTDVGDNSQTFSDDDIGQVALDMDNGFVYFGINGTYLKGQDGSTTGDPAGNNGGAGGSANHPSQLMTAQHDGAIAFMAGDFTQNTTGQIQCNFGGGAPFAISSGNTDGEGHGNFEFAPPTGFFALCTKNLGKYG